MNIHPPFPDNRRGDPKRQAELLVYDELADSDLPGVVLYEAKAAPHAPEVDYAIWLEGRARIALQVKGGRYTLIEGRWYLQTDAGLEPTPCPLMLTSDGAFSIRDAVKRHCRRKVFVIPVLLFPDMDPDQAIQEWSASDKTRILWGSQDLVNRLVQLAQEVRVDFPPTDERIRQEVEAIRPGLNLAARVEPEPEPATATLEVGEGRVVIHAGTVHVHVHLHITIVAPPNGGDDDGDGPPTVPDR